MAGVFVGWVWFGAGMDRGFWGERAFISHDSLSISHDLQSIGHDLTFISHDLHSISRKSNYVN